MEKVIFFEHYTKDLNFFNQISGMMTLLRSKYLLFCLNIIRIILLRRTFVLNWFFCVFHMFVIICSVYNYFSVFFQVAVDQDVYDCYCYLCYCPYSNKASYYRLHHLFDQTLRSSATDYFMVEAGSATVTITLNQEMYINKIKVFPVVGHYTKFKVMFFTSGDISGSLVRII